jgi:hypothetical protein
LSKFLKKADEMEISIQLKSIKIVWGYINIFLIIWCFYEFYSSQNIGLPFILMSSQASIYFASFLIYKYKMNFGDDDEE